MPPIISPTGAIHLPNYSNGDFTDVIMLTNTNEGYYASITADLKKAFSGTSDYPTKSYHPIISIDQTWYAQLGIKLIFN